MGAPGCERFIGAYDNRYNLALAEKRLKEMTSQFQAFENYYDMCFGHLPKEQVPKAAKVIWETIVKKRAEAAQAAPRHYMAPKPVVLPERDLTVNLDIMKPVPPEVRALIYQGISNEGRNEYLKIRYKEDPKDKYYFADCTNWNYTWDIDKVDLHKLVRIPRIQITQSFYRSGGVDRDPDHYRDAVKTEAPLVFPQI